MRMDQDGKKRMSRRVLDAVLPIELGFRADDISEKLGRLAHAEHDGQGTPKFWYPNVRRVGDILEALVRRGILTKKRHKACVVYAVARWWTY